MTTLLDENREKLERIAEEVQAEIGGKEFHIPEADIQEETREIGELSEFDLMFSVDINEEDWNFDMFDEIPEIDTLSDLRVIQLDKANREGSVYTIEIAASM